MVTYLRNLARSLHLDERAQDAFEYLLVIGGVSVAIILVMVTPVGSNLIEAVINGVCTAMDSIGGPSAGIEISCPIVT